MTGWRKRTILEMAHDMNAIEQLKSVLCDPTGKCCIKGSEEDRAIVDRALQALAQPVQEPVAWMYQCSADTSGPVLLQHKTNWAESGTGLWVETPLYTRAGNAKTKTS